MKFSLKTLIALVTVSAVVIGVPTALINQVQQAQRIAVAERDRAMELAVEVSNLQAALSSNTLDLKPA